MEKKSAILMERRIPGNLCQTLGRHWCFNLHMFRRSSAIPNPLVSLRRSPACRNLDQPARNFAQRLFGQLTPSHDLDRSITEIWGYAKELASTGPRRDAAGPRDLWRRFVYP